MHNLEAAPFTRFLKQPSGDPRLDSTHPWVLAFGGARTLATCACCGAGLKRAVITAATEQHPSGEVFGLDCYATISAEANRVVKDIAKRLTKSKKRRTEWELVFNDINDRRGLPALLVRFSAEHACWTSENMKRRLKEPTSSIWGTLGAIRLDTQLDDCDRAELLSIYTESITLAKRRAGNE
jgi:hypothetical protein